jgi:hypothetical protein
MSQPERPICSPFCLPQQRSGKFGRNPIDARCMAAQEAAIQQ